MRRANAGLHFLMVSLVAAGLGACGGGGGGGGGGSVGGGGGSTVPIVTVTPTSAPPTVSSVMGDVKNLVRVRRRQHAFDADDKILMVASGRVLYNAITGVSLMQLPGSDGSEYITAVTYSSTLHLVFLAGARTVYSARADAGNFITVAQGFTQIFSLAVDGAGTVYVVDNDHVSKISGPTIVPLTSPGSITNPSGRVIGLPQIAYDSADGALYVTDPFQNQLKRVTTGGTVTTFAGSCVAYTGGGPSSCWPGNKEGNGVSTLFGQPAGVAYDAANGLLYIGDASNNEIWSVDSNANATIVAGYGPGGLIDGNGLRAFINIPVNLTFGSDNGALYLGQAVNAGYAIASYATMGSAPPSYTPATQKFLTPSVPSQPSDLGLAPDGSVWVAETFASKVGHVTGSGITEFGLPNNFRSPVKVVVDASGNSWVTGAQINGVITGAGVIKTTPGGAQSTFFAMAQMNPPSVDSLDIGPDGNLWFSEHDSNGASLGTVNVQNGTMHQYWIGTTFNTPSVRAITNGADGNLWFTTAYRPDALSQATPVVDRSDTSGNFNPTRIPVSHFGIAMVYDPADGNFWDVDGTNTVTRLTPAGAETTFTQAQCAGCFSAPVDIAVAPDGTLWFTEQNYQDVAHMTLAGTVTRYLMPQNNPGPTGIAVRSDGKVWVTGVFGTVFLLDPVAYDAQGLPHASASSAGPIVAASVARRW